MKKPLAPRRRRMGRFPPALPFSAPAVNGFVINCGPLGEARRIDFSE
jgi:hypothetical protein